MSDLWEERLWGTLDHLTDDELQEVVDMDDDSARLRDPEVLEAIRRATNAMIRRSSGYVAHHYSIRAKDEAAAHILRDAFPEAFKEQLLGDAERRGGHGGKIEPWEMVD